MKEVPDQESKGNFSVFKAMKVWKFSRLSYRVIGKNVWRGKVLHTFVYS